jgi:hypothetical protein
MIGGEKLYDRFEIPLQAKTGKGKVILINKVEIIL